MKKSGTEEGVQSPTEELAISFEDLNPGFWQKVHVLFLVSGASGPHCTTYIRHTDSLLIGIMETSRKRGGGSQHLRSVVPLEQFLADLPLMSPRSSATWVSAKQKPQRESQEVWCDQE